MNAELMTDIMNAIEKAGWTPCETPAKYKNSRLYWQRAGHGANAVCWLDYENDKVSPGAWFAYQNAEMSKR